MVRNMEFKDEEDKNKALIAYSNRPEVIEFLKEDAIEFVKNLVKRGISKKDGSKLLQSAMELLPKFPAMASYTQIVLDEAKKQGFQFKDEKEKWT